MSEFSIAFIKVAINTVNVRDNSKSVPIQYATVSGKLYFEVFCLIDYLVVDDLQYLDDRTDKSFVLSIPDDRYFVEVEAFTEIFNNNPVESNIVKLFSILDKFVMLASVENLTIIENQDLRLRQLNLMKYDLYQTPKFFPNIYFIKRDGEFYIQDNSIKKLFCKAGIKTKHLKFNHCFKSVSMRNYEADRKFISVSELESTHEAYAYDRHYQLFSDNNFDPIKAVCSSIRKAHDYLNRIQFTVKIYSADNVVLSISKAS